MAVEWQAKENSYEKILYFPIDLIDVVGPFGTCLGPRIIAKQAIVQDQ
jgi:hypothetical protein